MTALKSVKSLVDRGLLVKAKISTLREELEEIEAKLEAIALAGEQVPLEDEERDGRQFIATGSESSVPVVITADLLVQSFQADSREHLRIKDAAGEKLSEFYVPRTTYYVKDKDGKTFRRVAASILGDAAPAFITACTARDKNGTPKNKIVVEWDRATDLITPGVEEL